MSRSEQAGASQGTVGVLVILDGASEPLGDAPTSLERARTPTLDGLAAEGRVFALRTLSCGLPAGSESAIPALLGWAPDEPVDRGALEAAAHGIELAAGERAWRVDRRDRANARVTAAELRQRLAGDRVVHLGGHRMLVAGRDRPDAQMAMTLEAMRTGPELRLWPGGATPPRLLDTGTVLVGARGAAVGIARLMGARTVVPAGATGGPDSDLAAKAAAALAAMRTDAIRVVVHVGGPDEAAHERDPAAKVASIEAADALLLAPLAAELRARRRTRGEDAASLRVCPDHGCDPASGEHDDAPVPCLDWPAARPTGGRLTERTVAPTSAPAEDRRTTPQRAEREAVTA
jgi:2,3-bisphosphoglycerate-independent phosphoglycerate mutase